MTATRNDTTTDLPGRTVERFGWTLLPLTLIALVIAGLSLLSLIPQLVLWVDSIGSTSPIPLQLHTDMTVPAAAGTHQYFGSSYIADGVTVTIDGVHAEVSGIDALTRSLLRLGPLLWTATVCTVATAIAFTLERLRVHRPARLASRAMLIAAIALGIGSTAAQLATSVGLTQVGRVAWDTKTGVSNLTAVPVQLFDFTPIGIAVTFLAIVLLIRRTETAPPTQ